MNGLKSFYLFAFYFVIFNTCIHANQIDNKIQFVKDFIQSLNGPVFITSFLCWSNQYKMKLIKELSLLNRQISIHKFMFYDTFHKDLRVTNNLYIADFDCGNALNFIRECQNSHCFEAPTKWLILNSAYFLMENENSLDFLINSEVVFVKIKEGQKWELKQPYKIAINTRMIMENYGQWDIDNGLVDQRTGFEIATRRKNLQGYFMRIPLVITQKDSMKYLYIRRRRHEDTITKVNYFFVNYLLDSLNATREFYHVPSWGYQDNKTGLYTGLIGELQRNRTEIAGTSCYFTKERSLTIEYVAPTSPTQSQFLFRQPPLSYISNVFTLPFTKTVWIAEVALIIIFTAVLFYVIKWENRYLADSKTKNEGHIFLDAYPTDITMVTMGAICQQGSELIPREGPGRMTMFIMLTVLMFLYTAYSANIVALLQSSSNSIRTLEDLLSSKLTLGAHDVVYVHYYFETATEPIHKAINDKKIAPPGEKPHYYTMEEGAELLRKGFFAFHCELGPLYKVIQETFLENEKCGLTQIIYIDAIQDPWLAVRKKTPYIELFKIGLKKIHERGLQSRELSRYYTKKPECLGTGNNFFSVGLPEIVVAFHILLIGIGLSIVFGFIEFTLKRKLRKN